MELIILLLVIILLDIAAWFWGTDSRDSLNSREWESRQQWIGFH